MKDDKLVVSEVFYSLQGEGSTMGVPAVFLRLAGCNLKCGMESGSWQCDSIEVWQKGKSLEFAEILSKGNVDRLRNGAHLIITGGEPLIQQVRIDSYLDWFRKTYKFFPVIEIETNGTIQPKQRLLWRIDQWNCSPKLSNSGESIERRFNINALLAFNKMDTIFKFVVTKESDWKEISEFTNIISKRKIWLMPGASDINELLEKNKLVSEMALKYQVNFSTRLQIEIWNKTTGV
jgi:organic radical activating enzyme